MSVVLACASIVCCVAMACFILVDHVMAFVTRAISPRHRTSTLALVVHLKAASYAFLLLAASHLASCMSRAPMRFEAALWWASAGPLMVFFFYLKYLAAPRDVEASMRVFSHATVWNYVNQRISYIVWKVNPRFSLSPYFQLACWMGVELLDVVELYLLTSYAFSLTSCLA